MSGRCRAITDGDRETLDPTAAGHPCRPWRWFCTGWTFYPVLAGHHAASIGSVTVPAGVRQSAVASWWENCGTGRPVLNLPVPGRGAAHGAFSASGAGQVFGVDESSGGVGWGVGLDAHGGLPVLAGPVGPSPWGGGVLSPAAVRRAGTASEARCQGRPQAVGAADAKHP